MKTDQEQLRARVEQILDEHRQRYTDRAARRDADMTEIDAFRRRFERVYESWRSEIIYPKFAVVVSQLPSGVARVLPGACTTTLIIRRGDVFTVGATVTLKVFPDLISHHVRFLFEVSILPILMEYDKGAEMVSTLDEQSGSDLAAFLDERLALFVSDYCRIHAPDSPYQRDATVVDPICGMSFLRSEAKASVTQRGGPIYFCSVACRDEYEKQSQPPSSGAET